MNNLVDILGALGLFEAPIEDLKTIGDFSKPGQGWDKNSAKLLNNPRGLEIIKKRWAKSDVRFNIYALKKVGASRHVELGVRDQDWVEKELGLKAGQDYEVDDDVVTIIFTNNLGTEKVPMTAWTMAHRLGHAMYAAANRGGVGKHSMEYLQRSVVNVLKMVREVATKTSGNSKLELRDREAKIWSQLVGTMKSARDSNIRTGFEFLFELIAQYIITGSVKFQPFDPTLKLVSKPFGKKSYERDRNYVLKPEDEEDQDGNSNDLAMYNRDLEYYAEEVEMGISSLLSTFKGKILIM